VFGSLLKVKRGKSFRYFVTHRHDDKLKSYIFNLELTEVETTPHVANIKRYMRLFFCFLFFASALAVRVFCLTFLVTAPLPLTISVPQTHKPPRVQIYNKLLSQK
jgi:hypothetical protein